MAQPNSHVAITKGNWLGHWFRRFVHISQFAVPLLYYAYIPQVVHYWYLSPHLLLWLFLALLVLLETIRVLTKVTLFGQREYERYHICAFAWGALAIFLVLLFAPSRSYAIPIIWACAFADPLLGELRTYLNANVVVLSIGVLFVMALWLVCSDWLGIAWWWALLMGPITVAAEAIRLPNVDDNALMMLVPLVLVVALKAIID